VLDLLAEKQARRAVRDRESSLATVDGHEGDLRVATFPVVREGKVVAVIQTGQLRQEVQGNVNRLILVLLPVGLGALVLAGVGGLFMSRRAMRPVRESFERQRTFVADASHELKSPLSLVKINAEVLLRDPYVPDAQEILGHQLSEINRMNELLTDLLTLARLDAGKLAVGQEPFDLAKAISETAERFSARAFAEGKRLEVRHSGKVAAWGDAERTGQILAALLDNALRHTPPGGLVTVTCRNRDGRAEAEVRDSGPGIPPEHLPRVFDRFYRAEYARTRGEATPRTGLGLSIARGLVRAQGGDLTAENAEGGGALFRLSLPAARGPGG
jgi:signal transduction histidine kinase